jgi:prepilin-type N-terminal cleavage/methylation domain-containing protein
MKSPLRSNLGFTLIEVVAALLVAGLILVAAMPLLEPSLRQRAHLETRERLARTANAIKLAYESDAYAIDDTTGARLRFTTGAVLANGSDASQPATFDVLTSMARIAAVPVADLTMDAGQNRLRYYVSNRLTQPYPQGFQIHYRVIAVVSPGWNGRFDEGTRFDVDTGVMITAGDDHMVIVDGYGLQRQRAEESVARARRLARAYESYFQARYLMSATRDVSIDYFANGQIPPGRWDAGNPVTTSVAGGSTATSIGLQGALGLAPSDLKDAWGGDLWIDNAGAVVRSPLNTDLAMALPPYTAAVRVRMPNGETYVETAIGAF